MHLYYISDEQRMVMELARSIAREKIAPVAAHHDETETYPEEPMRLLAQQGLMGIWLPEAYGGSDMGALAVALVAEEIAWACAATATNLGATPLGGLPHSPGGDRGPEAPVPAAARDAARSPPPTRSRSRTRAPTRAAIRTHGRAARATGTFSTAPKLWCSNGSHAGVITLFATVDPGKRRERHHRVPRRAGLPGFSVGKKERKMGIRALADRRAPLQDCEVPVENRLGEEGEGFKIAMRTLDCTRPTIGARPWASARRRSTRPTAYAKERRAVRPAHRGVPGHPVHARRHGDAGRTARGSWFITSPRLVDPGVAAPRSRPRWRSAWPPTPR